MKIFLLKLVVIWRRFRGAVPRHSDPSRQCLAQLEALMRRANPDAAWDERANWMIDVAEWLRQLAATPVEGPPLPGPHVLWWKAEVSRRIDQAQHVTQPLNTGERVQIACGFGIAFALLGWLSHLPRRAGELQPYWTAVSRARDTHHQWSLLQHHRHLRRGMAR